MAACLAALSAGGCQKAAPVAPAPTSATPAVTVTISRTGLDPRSVTIALGDRVLFVNNDATAHSIGSNPHPDHTDCPGINQVGFLSPGQRRETGNFVAVRSCGFHDHDEPFDQDYWGTIVTR